MMSTAFTTSEKRNNDLQNRCNRQQQRLHSIAWDPSNPSALLIVDSNNNTNHDNNNNNLNNDIHLSEDVIMDYNSNDEIHHHHDDINNNNNNNNNIQFHTLYSDTGHVGGYISSQELTALLHLISEYESFRLQQQQNLYDQKNIVLINHPYSPYRQQSQRYRDIISNMKPQQNWDDDDDDDKNDPNRTQHQLSPTESALLHQMNSILYLSEIYLLPPSSIANENNLIYIYSDGTQRNWLDCPGIATADTVHFLRQFVLPPPLLKISSTKRRSGRNSTTTDGNNNNNNDINTLEEEGDDEEYPPYDKFDDFSSSDEYWNQVLLYCKCGYLHIVWKMLQTHDFYVAAINQLQHYVQHEDGMNDDCGRNNITNDPSLHATLQAVVNEWGQIGSVLLTAPIPGGRSMTTEIEHDIHDDILLTDNDTDLTYIEGLNVSQTDYQYWEVPSASSSIDTINYTTNDGPIIYIPEIAIQKHHSWSKYVKYVRSNNRLCQKIPYIDTLMQLLSGDYGSMKHRRVKAADAMAQRYTSQSDSNNCHQLFSSWSEQLCCELLYRTPDLRPRTIASRTATIMKSYNMNNNVKTTTTTMHPSSDGGINNHQPYEQNSSLLAYEASIISIMQGNAGCTIRELYDLGGGSGAALPITLMSLVFDLFVEAQIIPQESVEKLFDFLIEASSSIVASTHVSHPDIGVQLAIRLLLPNISMMRSSARNEFAAAVSNIMEHYTPTTDHYARTALSLCTPALSKDKQRFKNTQWQWQRTLLDGCVSVLIQLYRKYERQRGSDHAKEGMLILLEGIDLESEVLPQPWLGTCYRLLEAECYQTTVTLLQAMILSSTKEDAELQHFDLLTIVNAELMSKVIARYIPTSTSTTRADTQVRRNSLPDAALLLVNVVDMFMLFNVDKYHAALARHVITILSKCGSSSSSSSIHLRWLMLHFARTLTNVDDIFDSTDVTILLQHLSEVTSCIEMNSMGIASNVFLPSGLACDQYDLQLCFHGLLLKTSCSQNSMKQRIRKTEMPYSDAHGQRDFYASKCDKANESIIATMLQ